MKINEKTVRKINCERRNIILRSVDLFALSAGISDSVETDSQGVAFGDFLRFSVR